MYSEAGGRERAMDAAIEDRQRARYDALVEDLT